MRPAVSKVWLGQRPATTEITKPLFIVVGGEAPRVPLSEAEQKVDRIKVIGSPFWDLMPKDEAHGFPKGTTLNFSSAHRFCWFENALSDVKVS